jgi:hypothetical protein
VNHIRITRRSLAAVFTAALPASSSAQPPAAASLNDDETARDAIARNTAEIAKAADSPQADPAFRFQP